MFDKFNAGDIVFYNDKEALILAVTFDSNNKYLIQLEEGTKVVTESEIKGDINV